MEINYEEEVKKVYPDAVLFKRITDRGRSLVCDNSKIGGKIIGSVPMYYEPHEAWKSAYETLKQQGKI